MEYAKQNFDNNITCTSDDDESSEVDYENYVITNPDGSRTYGRSDEPGYEELCSMDYMLGNIKAWSRFHGNKYVKINNKNDCIIVQKLITKKIIFENVDGIINLYYGYYYGNKRKYELMIKYYLIAIDLHYDYAAYNLGAYYESIKDYDNMLKYYLIAAELNNTYAMNCLASYYKSKEDHDNTIKYYLMSIKLNDDDAMELLTEYYESIYDCENIVKYYALQGGDKFKKLIKFIKNTGCSEILLIMYENNLQDILNNCKHKFIEFVTGHLKCGDINSDLLLLITKLDLTLFDNPHPLLILIKKLFNNEINLNNLQFDVNMNENTGIMEYIKNDTD